ncbi:hypothetical protein ACPA9J_00460 [Pseudomonas aeruginosa]
MEALTFKPEEWGMKRSTDNEDFMFLNLGPNHPSAHGAFRIILQLDGEEIVDSRTGHRLPPPRRREDGRASVLAQLHPVYRPYRIPRRLRQRNAVRAGGGKTGRNHRA